MKQEKSLTPAPQGVYFNEARELTQASSNGRSMAVAGKRMLRVEELPVAVNHERTIML